MRRTVEDGCRIQSKQGRRIDYADDAIRGIDKINNMAVMLPGVRGQPHSAADLWTCSENSVNLI